MANLRIILIAVFLLLLLVGGGIGVASGGQEPAGRKPVLLEFGAGFCYSCKVMEQIMTELRASHGEQVEFRLVYKDKEPDLFRQYKIMLIPTQVFLDSEGREVARHIGALTKEQVVQKLKELQFIP